MAEYGSESEVFDILSIFFPGDRPVMATLDMIGVIGDT